MESNIIQFPSTREYVKRKVIIAADKLLTDIGNNVGCLRMLGETDSDFRKRTMDKINGPDR